MSTDDALLTFRENTAYRRAQRILDVLLAAIALVLFLPVMVAAAAAICIETPGPALFRQRRVGRYGRHFSLYKFRTMKASLCGDGLKPADGYDQRITRVGRFLRRTSIDELPQLINVLRGDMAIVGPRPEQPFLVNRYERWQHLRHLIKPGVTGLWQVTCRSSVALHDPAATRIDLEYIRSASLATDGGIILRTIGAVLFARGAH